jgi:two-component system, NtrC family, sensor kinase
VRYSTKIIALLVLVSVAPVAASGIVAAALGGEAIEVQTRQLQRGLAAQTAGHVQSWFATAVADLERASAYLPFEQTSGAELSELVRVPFRQLENVSALALIDGAGKALAPPVYVPVQGSDVPRDLRNRPRLSAKDLEILSKNIPVAAAQRHKVAFGPTYRNAKGQARIVCAARVDRLPGGGVLAAELSLERVSSILKLGAKYTERAYLLDDKGVVVVGTRPGSAGASLARLPLLARQGALDGAYRSDDGTEVIGSLGQVKLLRWRVLLEQPRHQALAMVKRLQRYTLIWTALCLLLAVGGGIFLGRGVTRPVQALATAAGKMQAGDYDVQVPADGRDELSRLAAAFNAMASSVKEQKVELQRWNEELQRRVDEQTREVSDALDQVIRSQKLGAIGELAAGFAHELNNPLAGIMGLAQLVQLQLPKDDEKRAHIDQLIEQAHRISEVAQNLQRFCETPEGVRFAPTEIGEVCRGALSLAESALKAGEIAVELSIDEGLPRVRANADQLRQALLHLVHNAVRAMPEGGTLAVQARAVKGAVRIEVIDSGTGIPAKQLDRIFEPFYAADKTETHRPGLGLSVVSRIVTEHEGQISVRSSPGKTEFAISLPGVREDLHL